MEAKHTALPWFVDSRDDIWSAASGKRVRIAHGDLCGGVESFEEMHANTEFIARACNSHDALVGALKWIVTEKGAHPANVQAVASEALAKVGAL